MRTFFFLGGIVLLISVALFFRTRSTSGIRTRFSPAELAGLANNFSVGRIAGECEDKGFIRFSVKNSQDYNYYYVGRSPDSQDKEYESVAQENMIESLTTSADYAQIILAIKNKERYSQFIEYLSANEYTPPVGLRNMNSDSIYFFQNAVFINEGYNIKTGGFTVFIRGTERYIADQRTVDSLRLAEEQALEEQNKKRKIKALPINGPHISVNEAIVYEGQGTYFTKICKVYRDTPVKIIKEGDGFLYCDFVDADGYARTGWIESFNVRYAKPENTEVVADSITNQK